MSCSCGCGSCPEARGLVAPWMARARVEAAGLNADSAGGIAGDYALAALVGIGVLVWLADKKLRKHGG